MLSNIRYVTLVLKFNRHIYTYMTSCNADNGKIDEELLCLSLISYDRFVNCEYMECVILF